MNLELAKKALVACASAGVRELVVCSGARNAPFVFQIDRCRGVKVHHFFEERSAAFFALGRAKTSEAPVAVLTTSGTAVAELLPAAIEATYSSVPLIFLTADRPKRFRGTGAPQAIRQSEILRPYVEEVFDIDSLESEFDLSGFCGPTHLNLCFDEPLVDGEVSEWNWPEVGRSASRGKDAESVECAFENPLVIVGALSDDEENFVQNQIKAWNCPIYAEALSGLRECDFVMKSPDRLARRFVDMSRVDGVIRIGRVPTLRLWRDLENRFSDLPVLNFSDHPFVGLSRDDVSLHSLSSLSNLSFEGNPDWRELDWRELDDEFAQRFDLLLGRFPRSEVSLFRSLSKLIGPEDHLYVGNSLPIREWNLAADRGLRRKVDANRGANGIDGQLSSFFGALSENQNGWGIFGDLTAMYDLSSPWALGRDVRAQIVVMNNSGGQIFSRLFESSRFRNEHAVEFSHWAAMWNLSYHRWESVPSEFSTEQSNVIETVPCAEQSRQFWQEFDQL